MSGYAPYRHGSRPHNRNLQSAHSTVRLDSHKSHRALAQRVSDPESQPAIKRLFWDWNLDLGDLWYSWAGINFIYLKNVSISGAVRQPSVKLKPENLAPGTTAAAAVTYLRPYVVAYGSVRSPIYV